MKQFVILNLFLLMLVSLSAIADMEGSPGNPEFKSGSQIKDRNISLGSQCDFYVQTITGDSLDEKNYELTGQGYLLENKNFFRTTFHQWVDRRNHQEVNIDSYPYGYVKCGNNSFFVKFDHDNNNIPVKAINDHYQYDDPQDTAYFNVLSYTINNKADFDSLKGLGLIKFDSVDEMRGLRVIYQNRESNISGKYNNAGCKVYLIDVEENVIKAECENLKDQKLISGTPIFIANENGDHYVNDRGAVVVLGLVLDIQLDENGKSGKIEARLANDIYGKLTNVSK